jgi:predicted ATPase
MRIAFSGSHRVGKSTLLGHVAAALPAYATVDEPYYLLEEDGYEQAEDPTVEDFEAQLERSSDALGEDDRDVLFDRCPADVLAYLQIRAGDTSDGDDWIERARQAVQTLDLVVFVPIEEPDRVPLPAHEDLSFRRAVHERLHELLIDGGLGIDCEVLPVHGDLRARVGQVLARIRR